MTADPLPATLALFVALPIGLVLTAGLLPPRSRVARAGTATLAGLGVLAAVVHALACAGVPARTGGAVVTACSLVAAGWVLARALLRRRTRPADGPPGATGGRRLPLAAAHEILPVALIALMLASSAQNVRDFAVSEHDAIYIWAPKAARALDEAPPDLRNENEHAHPEYPRGLGIMTGAVAAPFGGVDPRLPRAVPLFLFAMTLLCVFDALSARGNTAGALLATAILGSLPPLLRHAVSGYADLPLGAFILLGCVGLAPQREGRPSIAVALAGGLGAMVVKEEGVVFCAALLAVLSVRLLRDRRPAAAIASIVTASMLAAPWVLLRTEVQTVPLLWRATFENFGLLLMRFDLIAREAGHLALGLPDPSPGGYTLHTMRPGGDVVLHAALLCALVLLIGRRGRVPVLPAGLLLLADFAAILMSHVAIDWQLMTALDRLVLQCLPLLVLAAVDKVTMEDRAAAAGRARTPARA